MWMYGQVLSTPPRPGPFLASRSLAATPSPRSSKSDAPPQHREGWKCGKISDHELDAAKHLQVGGCNPCRVTADDESVNPIPHAAPRSNHTLKPIRCRRVTHVNVLTGKASQVKHVLQEKHTNMEPMVDNDDAGGDRPWVWCRMDDTVRTRVTACMKRNATKYIAPPHQAKPWGSLGIHRCSRRFGRWR
jgi:hypothetical protein